MIATNTHDPHQWSETERKFWKTVGYCLSIAGLIEALIFWSSLASRWYEYPAHWLIALATCIAVLGGTFSLVSGIRQGISSKIVIGIVAILLSSALNILNQVGFFANSNKNHQAAYAQAARSEGLTDGHIKTLQDRVKTLQGDADTPRATQLRAEVDRLTADKVSLETQRADFARRNIVTAGVKPTQAKIDAISAQIEAKNRDASQAKGEAHSTRTGELAAAQAELEKALATAKEETKAEPVTEGAGNALFEVLSQKTGASKSEASSSFFLFLPLFHELLSFCGAFLLAYTSPIPHSTVRPRNYDGAAEALAQPVAPSPLPLPQPMPRYNVSPIQAQGQQRQFSQPAIVQQQPVPTTLPRVIPAPVPPSAVIPPVVAPVQYVPAASVPRPQPAFSNHAATAAPQPAVIAGPPDDPALAIVNDCIRAAFERWEPTNPALVGRDNIASRFALNGREKEAFLATLKRSRFCICEPSRPTRADFSSLDEADRPKNKDEALVLFMESIK